MAEDKTYDANKACPANYWCPLDNSGQDISPASWTLCVSDTTTKSSDASVRAGTPKKASQMQALHTAIKNEIERHRANAKHVSIVAEAGGRISFENSMNRIKENLLRLTGFELPVNAGDPMRASDIQTAYARLNTAQNACVCVERCTCNARAADICGTYCSCRTRSGQPLTCESRLYTCSCAGRGQSNKCIARSGIRAIWCSCDATGCSAETYSCSSRTQISPDEYKNGAAICNARTSVQCSCNIRIVGPLLQATGISCDGNTGSCNNRTDTCTSHAYDGCTCVTRQSTKCVCNSRNV